MTAKNGFRKPTAKQTSLSARGRNTTLYRAFNRDLKEVTARRYFVFDLELSAHAPLVRVGLADI